MTFSFILVLGYVDFVSGEEISFSVFYVAPITIAAWHAGRNIGLFLSVVSAVTWLSADLEASSQYSNPLIPVWNSLVRLGFFTIITILVSIIKQKLETDERLADTDSLTGVGNSRSFYERLDNELKMAKRYHYPFTVAYLDIDDFKSINDTMGHAGGDEVLREVADVIRTNTRETDFIARLGGDEFAGLFPVSGYGGTESVIQNIISCLTEAMKLKGWPVTFSVGAITFETPMDTANEMIKAVDDLMYTVKKRGKNNIIHNIWVIPEGSTRIRED